MMRRFLPALSILIVVLISQRVDAVNDVIVKYNKLFVDGKEYIIKGMAYNPAPLVFGTTAGLCSVQRTFSSNAADAYESHCYDSDFYDGNNYPDRVPPPPKDGWFSPLWERDLPKMAAIGVNTIRLYNVNPSNFLAYQRYNGQYNITMPGKYHIPFLDACAKYGLKVLWPLFADKVWVNMLPEEQLFFYMRTMIEEVGNHSAVLMYGLGNELNYYNNSDYNSFIKTLGIVSRMMNYARDYQRTYWNRLIPFTTAFDDNSAWFDWQAESFPVDIWMPNSGYRSSTKSGYYGFSNLWSGNPSADFSGFYKLSCKYQFPTLIGEMNPVGYLSPVNDSGPYPHAFPTLWRDLLQHVQHGAIGGFFFEWHDELWKETWDPPQGRLGINTLSIACGSGGCSNENNVFLADTITPKGWEFDAVCCGTTTDGQQYNFGTDVFELLGREQQTLDTAENECPEAYWDGKTFVPRGGYVSQYHLYPPSATSAPTTTPPPTTPPPNSTVVETTLPPSTSPTPTTTPPPTTSPPPPPPPTTVISQTTPPRTNTPNFGLTSASSSLIATSLLLVILLIAFV